MRRIIFFVLCLLSLSSWAQTRVIVPFPAGGGTDVAARVLFRDISERTGRQFVIENISGAGGDIGRQRAMRDNSLLFTPNSLLISAHLENLGFAPLEEFRAVVGVGAYPYLLSAHPSFTITNVKELRIIARRHGIINISSAGTAGANHLIIYQLARQIGFPVEAIPHKGTPDAALTTMSGMVPLMVSGIQGTNELVRAGKLRAVAVTTAHRDQDFPQVPTVQEQLGRSFDYPGWFGVVVPKRYDPHLASEIGSAALVSLRSPQVRQRMQELSVTIWAWPADKFEAFLRTDDRQWAAAARQALSR